MLCLNDQGGERMDLTENITSTLRASMGGNLPIVMKAQQGGAEICKDLCPNVTSVRGTSGDNQPALFDNHAKDCRYSGPLHIAPTVVATYGTGGNNVPLVSKSVMEESYCIASNIINRQDKNGGNGCGFQKNISYTLTTSDIHAICTPIKPEEKMVFGQSGFANYKEGCCTIRAEGGDNGGGSENLAVAKNLVRRLTPLECERLQGFPDGWTDIPKATDSPRYRALGNSVAVPCVDFIMRGIAHFFRKNKQYEEE
jgi:DNA (cytosine-5)-methyltransferase 1